MSELDLSVVDQAVMRIGRGPEDLIPILQSLQDEYGWLPEPVLRRVCDLTEITPAAIAGVSTFYDQFRHRPVGEHLVHVCVGTACHVKGAEAVLESLRTHLQIPDDDDTDQDGTFTLQRVACMGCCTLAPVASIEDTTYGHLTPERVPEMVDDFLRNEAARDGRSKPALPLATGTNLTEIRIGLGSCCVASGSGKVRDAIVETLAETGTGGLVKVKRVGCVGMCHQVPLVEVVEPERPSTLYARVREQDARRIVLQHVKPQGLLRRLSTRAGLWLENLLTDETWEPISSSSITTQQGPVAAFLGRQRHLATEHCGVLDPTDMDEYERRGGFQVLRRCFSEDDTDLDERLSQQEIIEQVTAAGLRGRGGAGFSTGTKWKLVADTPEEPKYIICNGDEGDPGAFMDRMLLESFPYRIIEGMIIAAYAVGASEGYLYIRAEYPLAVLRIREALQHCEQEGLLGEGILGSSYSLRLKIMEGAGAFVCGEETALLESIEGRRGMPRLRPPYPAKRGLHGRPTLVNNVETYSLVPWILRHGSRSFAAMGTGRSAGTKVFALAGKIRRGGLIEVPMGVTLRQIVEEIGGGMEEGLRLKAVQVGGPSGGCVPERLADTPVDFEALTEVGAMMGSGGLVVLDETDCMVDIARYFLSFTQDQSCGKCTFCRVGTHHMLGILTRLCQGQGARGDIERLEELARTIQKGSLCALGGTAPNPVLSTMEHFREEYEAHLQGRCPAGVCKALVTYSVTDECYGCTRCAQVCPSDAIALRPYEQHEIDVELCVRCGACVPVCPIDAIKVE